MTEKKLLSSSVIKVRSNLHHNFSICKSKLALDAEELYPSNPLSVVKPTNTQQQ